jgi:dihydrofolate reductase
MPMANILCLTEIDDTPAEADAFFPEFTRSEWEIIQDETHDKDEKHDFKYRFATYIKRNK